MTVKWITLITVGVLLIAAGTPNSSNAQCVQLPNQNVAVAWFPLDFCNGFDVNDMMTNVDATIVNGPFLALPQPGKVGCSYPFGPHLGGDSKMTVPDRADLDISTSPGMTIYAWVYLNDNTSGTIVSKGFGFGPQKMEKIRQAAHAQ